MIRAVVSCEHASDAVPRRYRERLRIPARVLQSHRGSDSGSLALARRLAKRLDAPLVAARATRLLVDANRSLHHPRVFSSWSERLSATDRERAVREHWQPHRDGVVAAVQRLVDAGERVLHLSVHSFTPRFAGEVRAIDVALLYDPSRAFEREFAAAWLAALGARRQDLRLRRNAPYRGTSDGLTTALRQRFPAKVYAGIELEVSQRFPKGPPGAWRRLCGDLVATTAAVLGDPDVA